ncbi:hypothetical protein [Asaia astilbis]|uniref:hypothetical protein n=1 Tax=Asaia astilbis TaxID=610244 RepID=UPI00047098E7|nr:hypothetical protein [Asaia astilbis]
MPKADASSSTTRRAVLSLLAALPLVAPHGTPSSSAKASDDTDAALLARLTQASATSQLLQDHADELNDEEYLALTCHFDAQLAALAEIRAVTPEGLDAKARFIQLYLPPYLHNAEADENSPQIRLLFSFFEDATRFAQQRIT